MSESGSRNSISPSTSRISPEIDPRQPWFIDAVERAFERLAAMPEIGPVRQFRNPRLLGIRMWPVLAFRNYLIFYRIAADEIQILRILHAARDLESVLEEES